MSWNLKGGVIIIGSLLWQDHLRKVGDDIRLNWRNSHLDNKNKIPVKVPIRYGRESTEGIMTMIFSNRMSKKSGFAYVVPLKSTINNQDELLCECVALSQAEGMNKNLVAPWGAIAYLLNDSTIEASVKKEIIKLFRQKKNDDVDTHEFRIGKERTCITKSLRLNINWVAPILSSDKAKIDEFHFLLATPTKPRPLDSIPTYDRIAETIKSDTTRKYFMNNLSHGIITYDDFEIAKRL